MGDQMKNAFLAALEELEEKKLDPVGQEDGDVDNDGDKDDSDDYILRRRKAIKRAMAKEEAERLDEVGYMGRMPGDPAGPVHQIHGTNSKGEKKLVGRERGQDKEAALKNFHRNNPHHKSLYKDFTVRKEEVEMEEGVLGAIGGALAGGALGTKFAGKAGGLAAKAAGLAGKGTVGKMAARAAGTMYAPAAGAALGGVMGDRLTRKRRNEDVDYDVFEPLNESEQLFFEENQEIILEAVAEYIYEEGIDYEQLTEEELNELIGRMARAVGRAVTAPVKAINNRVGITQGGRTARDNRIADKQAAKNKKVMDRAIAMRRRTDAEKSARDAKRELGRAKAARSAAKPSNILKKRSDQLKQRKAAEAERNIAQFKSSRGQD